MTRSALPVTLMLVTLASPLAAQYGDGMRRMGPRGPRTEMPTQVELAGPPSPDSLKQIVNLTDDQMTTYKQRWDEYTDDARPHRDSLLTTLNELRAARDSGNFDPQAMWPRLETVRTIYPNLQKHDRDFEDDQLVPLLTPDQKKAFDKWRDERKKAADRERDQRRQQMRERMRRQWS